MLGYEGLKHGGYSAEKARARAAAILEQLGLELPLDAYVRDLDIAVQQMIEIAKAFSRDVKLIIMDEPTSSLTNKEVDQLYKIIRNLKREGISTLFVSHKLEEIEEICDCLTVFRDGKTITSAKVGEITPDEMVYAMVGREITNYYTTIHKPQSEVVMELKGLGKAGVIEDVSFALHKGEVLGMTGLIGAGRTETAHMLFGLDTFETGQLLLEGKSVRFKSTHDALAAGVALVPENRKEQGIIPQMGVGFNITISVLEQFMHLAHVDHAKENRLIDHFFQALKIKAYSPEQLISNLSGGNQQKAIIARWLAAKPKVLILDEPTRGIDIGAKKEIYELIDQLLAKMPEGSTPILHSDMGWQYQQPGWCGRLEKAGVVQSMSRKGNCIDNGATEQVFGHMKDEFFKGQSWTSFEEFKRDLDAYVIHWNTRRRQVKLKGLTPDEFRNQSLAA